MTPYAYSLVFLYAALLDLKRAQEWVVTTKLGSSDKRPGTSKTIIPSCKIYGGELLMGLFMISLGILGLMSAAHWGLSSFVLVQGLVFFAFGFNMVDVGGLLGGRLDVDLIKTYTPVSQREEIERTTTVPVIQLHSTEVHDTKDLRSLMTLESAPPRINVFHASIHETPSESVISRPSSPSSSTNDSDTSLPSFQSGNSDGMSVIQLDDKRSSPVSSLKNIYAPVKSSTYSRKGFRIDESTQSLSEHVQA